MVVAVVIAIYVGLALVGWIIDRAAVLRQNKNADLYRRELELEQEVEKVASDKAEFERYRTAAQNGIEALAKEKALGFPWLARAYSEYFEILDGRVATNLETKKHPAMKSADVIRAMSREKATLRRENKSCANSTDITNTCFLS